MLYEVLVLERAQTLRAEAEHERRVRAARRGRDQPGPAETPAPYPDSGDLPCGNPAPEPVPAREATGVGA